MVYTEDDLKASVGKYGANKRQCYNTTSDQQMVQDLLNKIPDTSGGAGLGPWTSITPTLKSSPRWGLVSEELYQAIVRFQRKHAQDEGLYVDGHVDPHDRTIRALLKYAYPLMHIDTDALAKDLSSSMHNTAPDPVKVPLTVPALGPVSLGLFNRTSWEVTGSDSKGVSGLVLGGGKGVFTLKRKGVPMEYEIGYTLLGVGLSPVPVNVSWGPGWMPQWGTSIWTAVRKDLDFQDLIGPMVVATGAIATYYFGGSGSAIWFNAPLGMGLLLKSLAVVGPDSLRDKMPSLNRSAGGVAFLAGAQFSTPDLSGMIYNGVGWPNNS